LPKNAEELVSIDMQLRYALFGLECALGVSFSGTEWERVFRDAELDQVSVKEYLFFESSSLTVTGRVDAYESESIWLRIEGRQNHTELLQRVIEGAKYAALRHASEQ
jgi:hypothetical protein